MATTFYVIKFLIAKLNIFFFATTLQMLLNP